MDLEDIMLSEINQICCLFFFFLRPHPQHMEVPRVGVKSEQQLPAYATATAMWDLSRVRAIPGINPASSSILVGFVNL